jgi:hypothetical protein
MNIVDKKLPVTKKKSNKNLLKKTKAYLCGAMQYATDGKSWRETVKSELKPLDVTFFDPYYKPFIHDTPEDDNSRAEMLHWMETEQYDLVTERMKRVRGYDLRLVDLSDWFLCVIKPSVASWGTAEELSVIVREQKPIFIVIDDPRGKKACPLWLLSMISHKYIYDSLDEVLDIVKSIDSGIVKMNSDKWRLLKYDLR